MTDAIATTPMTRWTESSFSREGLTFPTYRQGSGPGVVVIHEIPAITPKVEAFGQEVVDAGFTVVMPSLFGTPGTPGTAGHALASFARACVRKEFTVLATGRTSPVATWLRALAAELHAEVGGPGVGAVGMCFTGGFALAMAVDGVTVAPVMSQPSLPLSMPFTGGGADLGLSPADLQAVKDNGCPVMGLRYSGDVAVGSRFETLHRELGDRFIAVEFPGRKHSVLTEHRQQEGVDRVLAFLRSQLQQP